MCTAIQLKYNGGSVIGRTMDYEVPLDYNGLYLPRGYHFVDDLFGEPVFGKYKALGMCFANRDPLKDAVNEWGLVGLTNAFAGFNLYPPKPEEGKTNISSYHYMNYALTHYKTVQDVINDLPNIHMASRNSAGEKVIAPDFHWMFSDPTGRCIVVEPKRESLVWFENPYQAMTNSPAFDRHVKRLEKFMAKDNMNPAKDLPGGYDPVSRFIRGHLMATKNIDVKNAEDALAHAFSILGAVQMPQGFVENQNHAYYTYTRYICAYEATERIMTVKAHTNPMVYRYTFEDIPTPEDRYAFSIPQEFMTSCAMEKFSD